VLKVVASWRDPDKLLDELEAAVRWLDHKLHTAAEAARKGDNVGIAVLDFQRLLRDRSVVEARHAAWRQITKSKRTIAEIKVPNLIQWAGDALGVKQRISESVAAARAELAEIDAELASLKQAASNDATYHALPVLGNRLGALHANIMSNLTAIAGLRGRAAPEMFGAWDRALRDLRDVRPCHIPLPTRGGQESLLIRAAAALKRQTELKSKLAALERDERQAVAVVSERVTRAVANAGGRESVAESVRACQLLTGQLPQALATLVATEAQAQAEHSTAEQTLSVLTSKGIVGAPLDHSTAAEAQAAAKLKQARQALGSKHRESTIALVAAAEAGDEPHRSDLERQARAMPAMFAAGFPEAMAASTFSAAILESLSVILTPTPEENR
jgi:hypothetical protein